MFKLRKQYLNRSYSAIDPGNVTADNIVILTLIQCDNTQHPLRPLTKYTEKLCTISSPIMHSTDYVIACDNRRI